MTVSLLADLAAFAGVFVLAAVLYGAAQIVAAAVGLVRGVDRSTVILAAAMAFVAGAISWLWFGSAFSSPAVHALASVTAPGAFLGYCGIYVLLGPITVDRSISLAMLRALAASERKGLVRSQLQAEVPFDRIFQKRIREMEQSGSIDLRDKLVITHRGLRILRFYEWLARILRVEFQ